MIKYMINDDIKKSKEYALIKEFYGNRTANRSKIPLMNHIDEGIMILSMIGADNMAIRAFCLHPLVQADDDLIKNIDNLIPHVNYAALCFALEYRRVANAYLSHRTIESIDDIELSKIPQINTMLIADKIQNYKDFIIYHKTTHPRTKELDEYFNNWFKRLDIELNAFKYCFNQLVKR